MSQPSETTAAHPQIAGPQLPQPHQQVVAWGYPNGPMAGPAGLPVPVQIAVPPPASTEPPEWVKQLAPVIMQQASKVAQSFAESRESKSVLDYQEADAARRDSKGGALVSHSVAIANIAHALADMKEVKARTETTGALEQAISRLASACVPVVEEKEPESSDWRHGALVRLLEDRLPLPAGTIAVSTPDSGIVPLHAFDDFEKGMELAKAIAPFLREGFDVFVVESAQRAETSE
jgi:hypothetical protein